MIAVISILNLRLLSCAEKRITFFQKICNQRGWSSGTAQYKKTYDSMLQIWDGLRQKADANKDGQVRLTYTLRKLDTIYIFIFYIQ